MTTTQLRMMKPLASPLPPAPPDDALSPSQWVTLMALVDTIYPSITQSPNEPNKLYVPEPQYDSALKQLEETIPGHDKTQIARQYLEESAASVPAVREAISRQIHRYITQDALKGLRVILSALDTRPGSLLMTGSTTPVHQQSISERQRIIQNWATSYLPPLKSAAKAFEGLATANWLRLSPTLGPTLGFPRAPIHGKPGKGYDYEFIEFPPGTEPETIETDIVIVGSGCGGGVCAKNLAEADHRVIVIDKAYYYPPEHLPMTEHEAGIHLFHNGGVDQSDDQSINVIAGNAWGGGGTVNWSASLQTQDYVRKEWADEGLPFFTSAAFQDSLDRVCNRMGVSGEHIEHNKGNQVLMEGARKLGYSYKVVPQNTAGKKHYCGYCTLGCGSCEKQGPVASFLPDAAKAGAKFIQGFTVDKVLFSTTDGGKKVATGIRGTWLSKDSHLGLDKNNNTDNTGSRPVIITAKRTILSAGTLASPLILLRSGLTNPLIGRNLHLHPAALCGAIFPPNPNPNPSNPDANPENNNNNNKSHPSTTPTTITTPTNPWEGSILTSVITSLENLDSHHHGCKLESTTMLPSWFIPFFPWRDALSQKLFAARMNHAIGHIVIVRESPSGTGRVYPDPKDGRCRMAYTVGKKEREWAVEGLLALAKVNYLMGAQEIFFSVRGWPMFTRPAPSPSSSSSTTTKDTEGINSPPFQHFLSACRSKPLTFPEATFGSAHQMGTCRMSSSPGKGVVDPQGRVWEVDEGLYVVDASVFPSASGVNPMVTNMGIADFLSRGIAERLMESVRGLEEEWRGEGE